MKVGVIGSGNVATHLVKRGLEQEVMITAVYSATEKHKQDLAKSFALWPAPSIAELTQKVDVIIVSVADDELEQVLTDLKGFKGLVVHTSGSKSFVGEIDGLKVGVLYPLQTFSKAKPVDFEALTLFIEGENETDLDQIKSIAKHWSPNVKALSSEKRGQLHLAAVFACNFANNLWSVADELLSEIDVELEVLKPLIEETVDKAFELSPKRAQTGPAIRADKAVIEHQKSKLNNHPLWKDIYSLITKNIQNG